MITIENKKTNIDSYYDKIIDESQYRDVILFIKNIGKYAKRVIDTNNLTIDSNAFDNIMRSVDGEVKYYPEYNRMMFTIYKSSQEDTISTKILLTKNSKLRKIIAKYITDLDNPKFDKEVVKWLINNQRSGYKKLSANVLAGNKHFNILIPVEPIQGELDFKQFKKANIKSFVMLNNKLQLTSRIFGVFVAGYPQFEKYLSKYPIFERDVYPGGYARDRKELEQNEMKILVNKLQELVNQPEIEFHTDNADAAFYSLAHELYVKRYIRSNVFSDILDKYDVNYIN